MPWASIKLDQIKRRLIDHNVQGSTHYTSSVSQASTVAPLTHTKIYKNI